jgi:hypothetical protein
MRRFVTLALCGAALRLLSCSSLPPSNSRKPTAPSSGSTTMNVSAAARDGKFVPLVGRIWRVSGASYGPASGSIYIFLPNGTLLETSCVETYRIATWSADPGNPGSLQVMEDQRPVFTATVGESTGNTLHLHEKLLHSSETRDLTLTGVDGEFVCPDLPK